MIISKEITDAIETYIMNALTRPSTTGAKIECVPELVAILERRPTFQSSQEGEGTVKRRNIFRNPAVLQQVKEVRESSDIKEVTQMLSSGKWIAFYAIDAEKCRISLGRISD